MKTLLILATASAIAFSSLQGETTKPAADEKTRQSPRAVQIVGSAIRWEYMVEQNLSEIQLNAYGAQGWELVGFQAISAGRNNEPNMKFIFKRPKIGE